MIKIFLVLVLCTFSYAQDEVVTSTLSDSIDLRNYQEVEKTEVKIDVDINASNKNGIYNFEYSPNTVAPKDVNQNILLNGNFDAIYRYKSLYFDGDDFDGDSNDTFAKILDKIESYKANDFSAIIVSIIGYTQKMEDNKTELPLNTGYTNFFQSVGQRDDIDPDTATKEATDFMEVVYQKLLDENVSKAILYRENRAGKDNLYTEEFSDGRDRNNRVNVAIYIKKMPDPDTDKDGVTDSKDYCPETPLGSKVDKNGCPYIRELDLKFDFDKATISDKKSLADIQDLSDFMNKYPAYHANIVGHTDSVGKAKYNMKLSERRADVVTKIMEKNGIDASRLTHEGRGESEPLFENINPFNRHKNRRTEVELTLPSKAKNTSTLTPRRRGLAE